MSNAVVRVPLALAEGLAQEVVALLAPVCERIEIAGSIRRAREDIGDIDLVCIPRVHIEHWVSTDGQTDLFGGPATPATTVVLSDLDQRCADLLRQHVFTHRLNVKGQQSWGSELKKGIYKGLNLDIQSATRDTWAYWLTIRTGPWEFSKRLVTDRHHDGFCPSHLHFEGGRLRHRRTSEPLETPTEQSLFAALGIAYVPPISRSPTVEPRRTDQPTGVELGLLVDER